MNNDLRRKPDPHTRCIDCKVRSFAWFQPCTRDHLAERQRLRNEQYLARPRGIIYRQGEVVPDAYTLYDGWAIQYQQLANGKRQILHVALPGDLLGYRYDMSTPVDHTTEALTDVTLCAFTANGMQQLLQNSPELFRRLVEMQSEGLRECHSNLANIGQNSTKLRIGSFFSKLFQRLRARGSIITNATQIPLTQEHIADVVGVTPVHVSRICTELRHLGILEFHHGKLALLDENKLIHLLNTQDSIA
ncbi:MAG: Crp/Fnr family transcriptional regulator [Thiotrichales bacterium]